MMEIENYFNEVSLEGFTTTFDSMYNSLQELANNPSSLTVRSQVINFGKSLTDYFNSLSKNLKNIQDECNFEIKNMVDRINSRAQQIASLTKQITTLEVNGGTANDLRDQRALLVDELSQIASISVTEKVVGDDIGIMSYEIKIDGQTLVDGGDFNQLMVIPREKKQNQNDIDGLYDVAWANGQKFNLASNNLSGSLNALYEIRDGNNRNNLQGTLSLVHDGMNNKVIMTDTTINAVEKLNIAETGVITIRNHNYKYSGFEVKIDDTTGKFVYEFHLEDTLMIDPEGIVASIGESINYKGIPYYLDQLNEFIRTYSKAFNDIHRTGKDLENNQGKDFFTATNKVSGREYELDSAFTSFNSQTGDFYMDIPDNVPLIGSYYFMTVENFTINSEFINDPKFLATATDVINGIDNNDIVDALIALKIDKTMFGQGEPAGFINSLVADIGIDSKKVNDSATSQENIIRSITNQRLSVSGVDIDEEAMSLVRFQNAYNLSAKVISVMDEIYERLIMYMGV